MVNYQHLKKGCDTMVEKVIKLNQNISAISAGRGFICCLSKGENEVDTEHYYNLWHLARKKFPNTLVILPILKLNRDAF
ncbi:hypothetical protein [Candidatus Williamhamiltonella defendens]|uniref:hypothetical protein n=1 Tax=Candidatus Williamhamiltonella defendens TaxID=138072 RepID=UPI00387E4709